MMHHVATPEKYRHTAPCWCRPQCRGRPARTPEIRGEGALPFTANSFGMGCSAPRGEPILSAIAAASAWVVVPASSDGYPLKTLPSADPTGARYQPKAPLKPASSAARRWRWSRWRKSQQIVSFLVGRGRRLQTFAGSDGFERGLC